LLNNHVDKWPIPAISTAKPMFLLRTCYIARNFSKTWVTNGFAHLHIPGKREALCFFHLICYQHRHLPVH